MHVFMAASVSAVIAGENGGHLNLRAFGQYFAIFLPLVIVVLALIPQLLFKSAERTLEIGPEGLSTQIGKTSGSRRWGDIATIQLEAGKIIITGKRGNAFIIPASAFPNNEAKQQFFNDIQQWHRLYFDNRTGRSC